MSGNSGIIFLIAAMDLEIKPLLSHFKKISKQAYQSKRWGKNVTIAFSGVGQDNGGRTARRVWEENPSLVVSVGFAGGLSSSFKVGDLLMAQSVRNPEGIRVECRDVPSASAKKGTLLTMDHVVQTVEEKRRLSLLADAVDMESFAVGQLMQEKKIPFLSVRIISDAHDESLPAAMGDLIESPRPVWAAMSRVARNPRVLVDLIKFAKRSKALSQALSEFTFSLLMRLQGDA